MRASLVHYARIVNPPCAHSPTFLRMRGGRSGENRRRPRRNLEARATTAHRVDTPPPLARPAPGATPRSGCPDPPPGRRGPPVLGFSAAGRRRAARRRRPGGRARRAPRAPRCRRPDPGRAPDAGRGLGGRRGWAAGWRARGRARDARQNPGSDREGRPEGPPFAQGRAKEGRGGRGRPDRSIPSSEGRVGRGLASRPARTSSRSTADEEVIAASSSTPAAPAELRAELAGARRPGGRARRRPARSRPAESTVAETRAKRDTRVRAG